MSAHIADTHDLIRVQGARENNLKDVSVEIPKRRLTVFTGVSGSGKSSFLRTIAIAAGFTVRGGVAAADPILIDTTKNVITGRGVDDCSSGEKTLSVRQSSLVGT